jgi:hypothetical protein
VVAAAAAAAAAAVSWCWTCSIIPLSFRHHVQVEDAKRALFLYGNDTSQTVKEVMSDLHKLKGVRNIPTCCSRLSRA